MEFIKVSQLKRLDPPQAAPGKDDQESGLHFPHGSGYKRKE
jgi:hypothetical protein